MSDSKPRTRERTINWPRMRPRFFVDVSCGAEPIMDALRSGGADRGRSIEGHFSVRHGTLMMPEADRQFWSTRLDLTVDEEHTGADGTTVPTRVFGVFCPNPEIWQVYVFAMGTLAVLGICGLIYGFVQLALGHLPWALLVPLLCALIGALVYTSTLVGQGLAAPEMYELRSYLDDRLKEAEEKAAHAPLTARESAQL
jgi:hypothetical protein